MPQPLGQHFLKAPLLLARIAEAVSPAENDHIIEIGPGHGELTDAILHLYEKRGISDFSITLIEKDMELAPALKEKYAENKYINVIEGDVRKELTSLVPKNGHYKIVGNIPYYLTGYLVRIISELENKPAQTVLTIQKEVAERICSTTLLGTMTRFWATPSIVAVLPKKLFSPPPKVDSATLLLETKKDVRHGEAEQFFAFVKMLFKQPRKTAANNLSKGYDISKEDIYTLFKKYDLSPTVRPHELPFNTIEALSNESVFRK
jgi:16S rRNA (adenine1518-N6/adenine1519-N6)-dimethyltransferase